MDKNIEGEDDNAPNPPAVGKPYELRFRLRPRDFDILYALPSRDPAAPFDARPSEEAWRSPLRGQDSSSRRRWQDHSPDGRPRRREEERIR
jgi:hypothetical protein